jgi:hypothetical protein
MNIVQTLPEPIRQPLRQARNFLRYVPYIGNSQFCPICKKPSKTFGKSGTGSSNKARCMFCGALTRHRLTWL